MVLCFGFGWEKGLARDVPDFSPHFAVGLVIVGFGCYFIAQTLTNAYITEVAGQVVVQDPDTEAENIVATGHQALIPSASPEASLTTSRVSSVAEGVQFSSSCGSMVVMQVLISVGVATTTGLGLLAGWWGLCALPAMVIVPTRSKPQLMKWSSALGNVLIGRTGFHTVLITLILYCTTRLFMTPQRITALAATIFLFGSISALAFLVVSTNGAISVAEPTVPGQS